MEPIAQSLSTYRPESSQTLSRPLSLKQVEYLFDSLKGQMGTKVADLFGGVAPSIVEREWAAGLAGFQKPEIRRGLDACATRTFAPTLGEFAQLCRPCLNPEFGWLEARDGLESRDLGLMGEWTHPAVFFAAIKMSPAVRNGEWARHRTAWTRVLNGELARGWREVPAPAMRVDHDAKVGPPPGHIAELLAQQKREIAQGIERRAFDKVLKGNGE